MVWNAIRKNENRNSILQSSTGTNSLSFSSRVILHCNDTNTETKGYKIPAQSGSSRKRNKISAQKVPDSERGKRLTSINPYQPLALVQPHSNISNSLSLHIFPTPSLNSIHFFQFSRFDCCQKSPMIIFSASPSSLLSP